MRESIHRFAELMESKLKENDHKGGWEYISTRRLLSLALDEVGELTGEILRGYKKEISPERVILECADVANYMMMIADNVRGERDGK